MYDDTRDLFSSTKSQIYEKKELKQVKLMKLYKSEIDSNTLLFESAELKIGYSQISQAKVVSTYVQSISQ